MSDIKEFESVDNVLKQLPRDDYEKLRKILFGNDTHEIEVSEESRELATKYNIELVTCGFNCREEQLRSPKVIRLGLFQHKLVPFPTSTPIQELKYALFKFANKAIRIAARGGVNIFCLPETWKRDEIHNDSIWNTAVVIDNHGNYLGKHRKNHIPKGSNFNEPLYYSEGDTGHPVFETEFGKIAVCFGRHYPLDWMTFGLNGAEIVFSPAAAGGETNEPLWAIEARNAAIANTYYTCAVNRVGVEVFVNDFTTGDGKPPHRETDYFYGSSYITAPNGTRSPGLSRTKTGLLIVELDLNLCRQVKDQWGLQMSRRLDIYAELLSRASRPDFAPQIIRKK